jgi:hypothetical protein
MCDLRRAAGEVDAADELEARVQVVDEQRVGDDVGHVEERAAVGRDPRGTGARRRRAHALTRPRVEQLDDALAPAQDGDQAAAVVERAVGAVAARARRDQRVDAVRARRRRGRRELRG